MEDMEWTNFFTWNGGHLGWTRRGTQRDKWERVTAHVFSLLSLFLLCFSKTFLDYGIWLIISVAQWFGRNKLLSKKIRQLIAIIPCREKNVCVSD